MASGLHKQRIWVQVSLEGIKIIDMDSNVSIILSRIKSAQQKTRNFSVFLVEFRYALGTIKILALFDFSAKCVLVPNADTYSPKWSLIN